MAPMITAATYPGSTTMMSVPTSWSSKRRSLLL